MHPPWPNGPHDRWHGRCATATEWQAARTSDGHSHRRATLRLSAPLSLESPLAPAARRFKTVANEWECGHGAGTAKTTFMAQMRSAVTSALCSQSEGKETRCADIARRPTLPIALETDFAVMQRPVNFVCSSCDTRAGVAAPLQSAEKPTIIGTFFDLSF